MGILRTDRVAGLGGADAITGSCFFDTKNYLKVESHDDFSLDGDFTIEWWTHRAGGVTLSDWFTIGDSKNSTGLELYIGSSGSSLVLYSNNGSILTANSGSPSQEVWHHMAVVRSSNTIKIYVDGTADSTTVSNSSTFSGDLHLGVEYYNGSATVRSKMHMSNFRILKGTALYTANFTPPNTRLENISGTSILCCQSPGDVTQEATGKTITAERSGSATTSANVQASRFTPNSPVGFSTTTDVGTQFGSTFDGVTTFDSQAYMVPPGGNTRERNRGRAVFTGGYNAPQTGTTEMEFFNIQSGGLTEEFGNQSVNRRFAAGLASPTRGVTGGSNGTPSWVTGTMEFVTIANSSNTTTFGNMTAAGGMVSACSSSTRGIFFSVWDASGSGPAHKGHIDFITIATTGNSADFGQLSVSRPEAAGFSSPTRGICAGGYPAPDGTTMSNVIDFITIATTGNASDFGDLTQARQAVSGASSQTRGVVAGGYVYGSPAGTFNINTIDFITIASTGNATDFGDLIVGAMAKSVGNCSDLTRGVFAGGKTSAPTYINTIEFVTIASTGNASDFGDLKRTRAYGSVFSDSHGGLE